MKKLTRKINDLRELEGLLVDGMSVLYRRKSHRKRMRMVKKYLKGIIAGKAFLDVGCSEGLYCEFARKNKAINVIGIDIAQSKIYRAIKRFPKCSFWALDGNDVKGKWDIILCSETLQHVIDYIGLVKNIKEALDKNGTLIITVPNLSKTGGNMFAKIDEKMSIKQLLNEVGESGFGKQNAVWKFNITVFIEEIKKCGLRLIDRIPVDTPDGEIKELWSIIVFKK